MSDIITHLCELCWQRIDDFQQFCIQVENIQKLYEQHFRKEDGTYTIFEDIDQYHMQIESIHNEFVSHMPKQSVIDDERKLEFMEPFCIINVDETPSTVKTPTTKTTSLNVQVKEEQGHREDYLSDESETLNATDALNTDSIAEENCDENSDNEDEFNLMDDDGDHNDEENDEMSSDSSYQKVKDAPKKRSPRPKRKRSSNVDDKKEKSSPRKASNKKFGKKLTVTSVNVLDENNRRLLQYVQMKCDVCSDDRQFDSFADIQTHFIDVHRQSGYIICCNRKFRRIGRVLQHCTWHDNPEAFK